MNWNNLNDFEAHRIKKALAWNPERDEREFSEAMDRAVENKRRQEAS